MGASARPRVSTTEDPLADFGVAEEHVAAAQHVFLAGADHVRHEGRRARGYDDGVRVFRQHVVRPRLVLQPDVDAQFFELAFEKKG